MAAGKGNHGGAQFDETRNLIANGGEGHDGIDAEHLGHPEALEPGTLGPYRLVSHGGDAGEAGAGAISDPHSQGSQHGASLWTQRSR